MNIEKANNMIEDIERKINNLLNQKEEELSEVLPKSREIKEDVVFTSRIQKNKFLYYVYSIEKYDKEIDLLEKVRISLIKYIDGELLRLKKYKRVEELIIYYRENKIQKYNWQQVSKNVGLCQTQCRNIYRNYKCKRNV